MRKTHFSLGLAIALATTAAIAIPVIAQNPAAAPAKSTAAVAAGTYAVEGYHTQILFSYDHMGLTQNMGLLSGGTGTLTIDPAAPDKAALSVEVPINTIHTTIAKLDEEFQGDKFFDAAKFPTAKFVSTSVKVDGDEAEVLGNLTIKGITKPVRLKAEFEAAGANPMSKKQTIAFEGSTTIKRSDFGLGTAVPVVGDEVKLDIVVAFEKQ